MDKMERVITEKEYQELEAQLSKYGSLVENNYLDKILIVEGESDEFYIRLAWRILTGKDPKFKILSVKGGGGGSKFVKELLRCFIGDNVSQKIVGLFDRDSGGFNEFNSLDEKIFSKSDYIINNIEDGLVRQAVVGNVYALMLPVPSKNPLYFQVIKTNLINSSNIKNEELHFGIYSEFEIESLLNGQILDEHFIKKTMYPSVNYSDSNVIVPSKTAIKKYVEDNQYNKDVVNISFFKYFKPLVDKLEELFGLKS